MREQESQEREESLDELIEGYLAYYSAGKKEKRQEFLGKIHEWAAHSPARLERVRKTLSEELRERQKRLTQTWESPTDSEALRELARELSSESQRKEKAA